jgi:phosphopantetheinyl transferase (holo-ACP synthase)
MLGNDIVDLRDPDARPESFRARFDDRVFSAEEQRAIAQDSNPLARRWAHWGAKEAAYKLAKQLDSRFVFTPGRLVAHYVDDEDKAAVSRRVASRLERRGELELPSPLPQGIRILELRSFETLDRVHVVAVPQGSDWGAVEMAAEMLERKSDDPSLAVRALAIRGISRSLGIAPGRLSIGREGRIPTVELDGLRTPLSLSLSHHGDWIAYAMRLRVDLQNQSIWTEDQTNSAARVAGAVWTP